MAKCCTAICQTKPLHDIARQNAAGPGTLPGFQFSADPDVEPVRQRPTESSNRTSKPGRSAPLVCARVLPVPRAHARLTRIPPTSVQLARYAIAAKLTT